MSTFDHVLTDRLELRRRPGLATELARAACSAASSVDPDVPFVAWVAAHNAASRKVAERLGLTNCGLGVDPSDGQHRLAYADRPGPELGLVTTTAAGTDRIRLVGARWPRGARTRANRRL